MNVINFTPQSAFLGGIIIGLAVILFFVGNQQLKYHPIADQLMYRQFGLV